MRASAIIKRPFLIAAILFSPGLVFAGSQTYTTPSTYSFTVPYYSTLTVEVWGGGAGADNYYAADYPGQPGGASSFNESVVAYGGTPSIVCETAPGTGGTATGGDSNYTGGAGGLFTPFTAGGAGGNGANGGGSGGAFYPPYDGLPGNPPGGGGAGRRGCDGAGGGGAAVKTYSSGQLAVGSVVSVVVGAGGLAGVAPIPWSSGNGAPGEVYISWTTPSLPTCTLSVSPNPLAYGSSATLSWSSTNATTFDITWVGPVGASGSTSVSPAQTTTYTGTVSGPGGNGTCSTTLTVNPPAGPSATITADSNAIQVGQSTGVNATFSAGSGDTITADNIDSPVGTGLGPDTSPGPKSITFTPTSPGTYTFYARATSSYYPSWTTYAQTSVTVTAPAPNCSLSASPSSIAQGNSSTLSWSCSNADSCTGANFSMGGAANGSMSVSPSQTTTYSGSCTGPGGTANINTQVAVSCTQSWSCSGQTIEQTNPDCSTTPLATCRSPQFCQNGISSCQYPSPGFNSNGNLTGHLQVIPSLVRQGNPTKVYWNVSGVQSCSVTGSNGDSWAGLSAPSGGETSKAIKANTLYTLFCQAYGSNPNVSETQSVNVVPIFKEQ